MELPDINAQLSRRTVVASADMEWEPSPSGTVWRKPLFRQGGEYGPVTSIVRYDAGGAFRAHTHPQGEEILVLEGVFADDHGQYPAGTYLLNPDGSSHAPASPEGCTLLVRLRQYAGADRVQLVVDSTSMTWQPDLPAGTWIKPLYRQHGYPENMALVKWEPGAELRRHVHFGGEEVLVLDGGFQDEHGHYPKGTWIRMPQGSAHRPFTREGCTLYVRVGGLMGGETRQESSEASFQPG
ncbi:MAG: cupin domain-containing protein [Gammaproteobacteria bacterium]